MGDPLLPWLAGALCAALVSLIVTVFGTGIAAAGHASLLLLVCTIVAVAGLVAARSDRELAPSLLEERARPATEELDDTRGLLASEDYVTGMSEWARAMRELLEHALSVTGPDDPVAAELAAAADDTEAVLELIGEAARGSLSLNERATLHAVCTLWETNQASAERRAEQVDGAWHRRWRARSVVAARLRHGSLDERELALPFR